MKGVLSEIVLAARAHMNGVVDALVYRDPSPRGGSEEEYRRLYAETRTKEYPDVDQVEKETGYALDREWLDELALHTQIVKKKSELAYPHGRLLYSLLRKYIADRRETFVTVCETGTARGFSAVCMAKAIADAGISGRVVTFDIIPHLRRRYWNCIDDIEGMKSRAELLAPWSSLLQLVTFVHGDTRLMLERVGMERVNFAFLDAQHVETAVLHEFATVSSRQRSGDMVVFDDVTPSVFPGVVAAVDKIEEREDYTVERLSISNRRAYAWATKN